jgi:hypothetical protein
MKPYVEFAFLVAFAYFIFPVGRKSFFRDFVHAPGAYLYLDPIAVGSHHSKMQRLITVGFRY